MLLVENEREEKIVHDLKELRDTVISGFESLEPSAKFERTPWNHHSGGGGEISTIQGDVFEKAAVNWSGVYGNKLPFKEEESPFFATGVSLITHMKNPMMPTVHMNVRYIRSGEQFWFGGGYDLTPMGFDDEADTNHFHTVAKNALGDALYEKFSQEAKEYYFIKHWNKERGVGGIFFDHYNTGNFENDYSMWKNVGSTFLDAILPIYQKKKDLPYTDEDKALQNKMRAHYVEFNLLYDRGTKFGFVSGGNPEAILCSMPPTATW